MKGSPFNMTRKVTSYRLPEMTLNQIEKLAQQTGSSDANVIAFAIDRMFQQEIKTVNTQQAKQLATVAVDKVKMDDHEFVKSTIIVGLNSDGYWVTDNGEEVAGLTKEKAIEIITENLIS